MKSIFPPKLKAGDTIRIISPSRSMSIIAAAQRELAIHRFREMGLKVEYAPHVEESDMFFSSSIASRVSDIHDAFSNPSVNGIFTTIGGFNSNQLLNYLDWDLIQRNPKILCGYSDITILSNSIHAKTGLVGYYGPHFSTMGQKKGLDYSLDYLKKCLFEQKSYSIQPSATWSDDDWYIDQENRHFIPNPGWAIIHEGMARGKILGGNLNTFNLLQGTRFFPKIQNTILFLEDDYSTNDVTFDRCLQSLIHQPGFEKVRGLVIGRFQKKSEMSIEKLSAIIQTKKELENIPILANVDFGHTDPKITFPIGGSASMDATPSKPKITILKH